MPAIESLMALDRADAAIEAVKKSGEKDYRERVVFLRSSKVRTLRRATCATTC